MPQSSETNPPDTQFVSLLAGLARADIDFAVVGGLAVILNGYPRVTLDVDILVEDSEPNLRRLLDHLATWGEGFARELTIEDFPPDEGAVRIGEDFELDVFTRMRGRSIADFRPRLRCFEFENVRVPYLAPEDLIDLKKDSSRDKDKLDVLALRDIIAEEQNTR
jgi:uncharacterized nucleotidyltransferase DUF6036